jgi:spore cortex biosynthesis protein YabQ
MTGIVTAQAYVFLWAVMGGALIALLFDVFRIIRKAFKTGNVLTYIEDIVFWIAVAFIMFTVAYISNDGQLRSYVFLGVLLGVVLYAMLLSKPVMLCSDLILRVLGTIIKAVYTVVSLPVRICCKVLAVPVAAAGRASSKAARGLRQINRSRRSRTGMYRKILKNRRKKI